MVTSHIGVIERNGRWYEVGSAGSIVLYCPHCDPTKKGPFRFRGIPDYWNNQDNEICFNCPTKMEPIVVQTKRSHKWFRRKLMPLLIWIRDRRLKKLLKGGEVMRYTCPVLNKMQRWVNWCNPNFP